MATVQHNVIPEADLHESKGVSTASNNSIYIANGAGSGTWKVKFVPYLTVLSPASVAANTTAEELFTITGIAIGDIILSLSKPTAQVGLGIVGFRVSTTNQIGITFSNETAAPIVPTASQTYSIVVYKV